MRDLTARAVALRALSEWRTSHRFADTIAQDLLSSAQLSPPDRRFTLELFYGVLRNLTLLDFWIDALRSGRIDLHTRDLLRLGIYQLFLLETPEHAAVFETVDLAPKRARPLVNGVLRSAIRNRAALREDAERQPLPTLFSHPQFLVTKWSQSFGAEHSRALCRWNNEPPLLYARINKLRVPTDEFRRMHPEARPVAETNDFVFFPALPGEALEKGHCYVQDPSTAIAGELLDPQPDESVLDACAAPGGKTGYLAQLMQNRGRIVACDRDVHRFAMLRGNMQRLGATIVECFENDWTAQTAFADQPAFDRILLDAPCSNTGVIRRRVDVRWRLHENTFSDMKQLQLAILRSVAFLLKPGGVLVYSTCSIEPEENEQVVAAFLKERSTWRLTGERSVLPFRDRFDGAFAARLQSG
jgi:16S rRNA (cytosine967-C5)-methyltransferase